MRRILREIKIIARHLIEMEEILEYFKKYHPENVNIEKNENDFLSFENRFVNLLQNPDQDAAMKLVSDIFNYRSK